MKVLLAIDDSIDSGGAVKGVARFFNPRNTKVRIVRVLPSLVLSTPSLTGCGQAPEYDKPTRDARALIDSYGKQLGSLGFDVSTFVERGDVRESIVESATGWHADVIVVGSGRHLNGRLLIGGVAEWVVKHADCSVVVVRSAP